MSLSGKLEIFPLEEVLRLLARSHQNGCLRIEGQGAGRIYLEGGSVTYAAVEPDEALRGHLLAAGVVTESGLNAIDLSNGSLTEALAPEASTSALSEVIREQCVESVHRIRRPQAGPFTFLMDSRPRYATGQSFDIEMIISEADRRAVEWAEIEEAVPELTTSWRMVPAIEEESVKLSDTAWRFLAALEGSSSVRELSQRLGLTDFQAARRMAELSRARLVETVTVEGRPMEAPTYESAVVTAGPSWTDSPEEGAIEEPAAEAPVFTEPEPAPERSWWEQSPAPHAEETTEADPDEQRADEGSFLETVFAKLEETGEATEVPTEENDEKSSDDSDDSDDDEGEGGFGLLRRRGLGAAFRELADS
jgi:hypothetical protein